MSSRFINTGSSRLRPPLYTSRPKAQSSNHFPPASNLPRHMGSSSLTPVNAEYLLMIPKLMPTPPGSPSAFQIHICGWVPHISTSSTKPSKLSSPHPSSWFPQAPTLPTVVNGSPIHPVPQAKSCGVPQGFLFSHSPRPIRLHCISRVC